LVFNGINKTTIFEDVKFDMDKSIMKLILYGFTGHLICWKNLITKSIVESARLYCNIMALTKGHLFVWIMRLVKEEYLLKNQILGNVEFNWYKYHGGTRCCYWRKKSKGSNFATYPAIAFCSNKALYHFCMQEAWWNVSFIHLKLAMNLLIVKKTSLSTLA
jgi:hypothetical protein